MRIVLANGTHTNRQTEEEIYILQGSTLACYVHYVTTLVLTHVS
jgi:hypothetical protein